MSRSIITTALAAAFVCWCGPATAGAPSLFPLRDGATWKLNAEGGAAITIKAGKASSGTGFVVRGLPGLQPTRLRSDGRDVDVWNAGRARWEPFLRLGAPAGARYRVAVPGSVLWRAVQITVASRTAVCNDANGRAVHGCVRLTLRSLKPVADAGVEELVFAPGIGLVEIVVQTIAGPRTYTLDGSGASLS